MESTVTYKCPNCDAGLVYDAEKHLFTCDFCRSEFTEEDLGKTDSAARAEEAAKANAAFAGEVREYVCPSCGAEVLTDTETVATTCFYCHNPLVLTDKVAGVLKPDKIIPFKFDKEKAKETFLRFAKKKFFVPRDYFSPEQTDKIAGVYYPFWVTDADTDTAVEATAAKIRTWRSGKYRYTETSRYHLHRRGKIHFEDIVNSALHKEDKNMLEGVLPYPSDAHQAFSMPYLLGFSAKRRDVDREALSDTVRRKMEGYAKTLMQNTAAGYSGFLVESMDMRVTGSHWDYTLMPLWILTYQRQGKTYLYAMNGYTGKVYGELPISFGKLFLVFGTLFAVLTVLFGLIGGWLF